MISDQHGCTTSGLGHKVSYYFTNIPECLPIFLMRQQFEVCGILTDVFIARRRNARGQIYGFVRFSNVKNSSKLSHALNNVWFGHLRVWAREAKFDRFAANDKKPLTVSKPVKSKTEGVGGKKELERVRDEGENMARLGEGDEDSGRGRRGEGEKMLRFRQVEVRVNDEKQTEGGHSPVLKGRGGSPKVLLREKVVVLDIDEDGKFHRSVEEEDVGDQPAILHSSQPVSGKKECLLEYQSNQEDMDWAESGVVATVVLGETILSIQQRVDDVGFNNVEVISMGGDKVFLRSRNNEDIFHIFNESIHFFSLLFSKVQKWTSTEVCYERGAWVRLYGTPAHAWNLNFFKMCVLNFGRFVRTDECTVDRGRIDYARILITTTSLEVLNMHQDVLIDGCKHSIKFLEEWGCNLGEDAFLTENVTDDKDEGPELFVDHGLDEDNGEVDALIANLHRDWNEHEAQASIDKNHKEGTVNTSHVHKVDAQLKTIQLMASLSAGASSKALAPICVAHNTVPHTLSTTSSHEEGIKKVTSFEGITFKKKSAGGFRNSSRNLKRVARMPAKDRREILKILER